MQTRARDTMMCSLTGRTGLDLHLQRSYIRELHMRHRGSTFGRRERSTCIIKPNVRSARIGMEHTSDGAHNSIAA